MTAYVSWSYESSTANHAATVWGCGGNDAAGLVKSLYLTDSDDYKDRVVLWHGVPVEAGNNGSFRQR